MLLLGNGVQLFKDLVAATEPNEACNIINDSINLIEGKDISLLSGLAGLGYSLMWAQPYLQETIQLQTDEWLSQIDDVIIDYCNNCLKETHYDYFTGLFGGLFYLLQRTDRSNKLVTNIEDLIEGVSKSIQTVGSLNVIESDQNIKNGVIEFGVAHGQAGYAAVLSHAISKGIAKQYSENLFYQMLDSLDAAKSLRGYYPDVRDEDGYHYVPFRWCRGGFGITATLYFALRRIGKYAMASKLILDIPDVSKLEKYLSNYKVDHTFCHGTQGLNYILTKLLATSKSAALKYLCAEAAAILDKQAPLYKIDFDVQAKGILQGNMSSLPNDSSWDNITLL